VLKKIIKYWLAGIVFVIVSGILLGLVSMVLTVAFGSNIVTWGTNPTTGESMITGINTIFIVATIVIGITITPIIYGAIAKWVSDKFLD
jgi:hypothetical protein